MNKKYILFPDNVVSKTDGQIHYINEYKLAELYGVDMRECIVVKNRNLELCPCMDGLIELGPLYSGKYRESLEFYKKTFVPLS